jgi:hypothetical protein
MFAYDSILNPGKTGRSLKAWVKFEDARWHARDYLGLHKEPEREVKD